MPNPTRREGRSGTSGPAREPSAEIDGGRADEDAWGAAIHALYAMQGEIAIRTNPHGPFEFEDHLFAPAFALLPILAARWIEPVGRSTTVRVWKSAQRGIGGNALGILPLAVKLSLHWSLVRSDLLPDSPLHADAEDRLLDAACHAAHDAFPIWEHAVLGSGSGDAQPASTERRVALKGLIGSFRRAHAARYFAEEEPIDRLVSAAGAQVDRRHHRRRPSIRHYDALAKKEGEALGDFLMGLLVDIIGEDGWLVLERDGKLHLNGGKALDSTRKRAATASLDAPAAGADENEEGSLYDLVVTVGRVRQARDLSALRDVLGKIQAERMALRTRSDAVSVRAVRSNLAALFLGDRTAREVALLAGCAESKVSRALKAERAHLSRDPRFRAIVA